MDSLGEALSDLLKANELDPSNYEVATLVKKLKDNTKNSKKRAVIEINKDDD